MKTKKNFTKNCAFCGAKFTTSISKKKFCSYICSSEYIYYRNKEEREIRYIPTIKNCNHCSKEFTAEPSNKKYCSIECSKAFIKDKYKKAIKERICEVCGKVFTEGGSKYCSNECRRISNLKEHTCKICGKSFRGGKYHKYCSDECKAIGKKYYEPVEKRTLICPVCNSPFISKSSTNKYCSNKCRNKIKNSSRPKKPPIIYTKECPICSISFTTNLSKKIYCSPTCSKKASNKRKSIREKEIRRSTLKPIYNKVCPICSKKFTTTYKSQKYCSKDCIKKNALLKLKKDTYKTCSICGKEFKLKRGGTPKCCSKECSDTHNKIIKTLRRRFKESVGRIKKGSSGSKESLKLLGCTLLEFKKHIETQFEDWMTWDNHGQYTWHIDHIIPVSSFDLTNEEEVKKCFHYTNLQPLHWEANLKKSNRIKNEK